MVNIGIPVPVEHVEVLFTAPMKSIEGCFFGTWNESKRRVLDEQGRSLNKDSVPGPPVCGGDRHHPREPLKELLLDPSPLAWGPRYMMSL